MVRLSESVALDRIRFRSANDLDGWDPMKFELYGSNDSLAWNDGNWQRVVGPSTTNLTTTRQVWGNSTAISNAGEYQYYKVVFTETRGIANNSYYMQVADIELGFAGTSIVQSPPATTGSQLAITNNGPLFSLVPDLPSVAVTATLAVDASGFIDVATPASGAGITVSGDRTATVKLTGTLAALNTFLQTNGNVKISQNLLGDSLTMSLSTASSVSTTTTGTSFTNSAIVFKNAATVQLSTIPDLRTLAGEGWTQRMWFDLDPSGAAGTMAMLATESTTTADIIRTWNSGLQTPYSTPTGDANPNKAVEGRPVNSTYTYADYGEVASGWFKTDLAGSYNFWVIGDDLVELWLYDSDGKSLRVSTC
jgi:hypothetical protein